LKLLDKKLAKNIFAVYVITLLGYLAPLIVIPVLASRLSPIALGEYFYVQSAAALIAIAIEYGFSISATRQLAAHPEHSSQAAVIVSQVLGVRTLLIVLAALALLGAGALVPVVTGDEIMLLLCLIMAAAQGASAVWYFQALERAGVLAKIETVTKLTGVVATIVLVPHGASAAVPMAIMTTCQILSSLTGNILMYREVRFRAPSHRETIEAFRGGAKLFIYRLLIAFYNSANTVFLGWIVSADRVAVYAVAERIVKAALLTLTPLQQAIFARSNRLLRHDASAYHVTLLKLALGTGVLGSGIALVLALLSGHLMDFFLHRHDAQGGTTLALMALIIPLSAVSGIICNNFLIPAGRDGTVLSIVAGAAVLNALCLFLFFNHLGALGAGMAWLVVEFAALVAVGCAAFSGIQAQRRAAIRCE
jgi:polysaccharide transporter, PST family